MGFESSVVGVARWYAPWVGTLVIDEADAGLARAVEAEGVRCVVAPTVMSTVAVPPRCPGRCSMPSASTVRPVGRRPGGAVRLPGDRGG